MLRALIIVCLLCAFYVWMMRRSVRRDLVGWIVKAGVCIGLTVAASFIGDGLALRVSYLSPLVLMLLPMVLARVGERANMTNPAMGVMLARVASWMHPFGAFIDRPLVMAGQNAIQRGDWDEANVNFAHLEERDPRNRHWRASFSGDDEVVIATLIDGPRDQSELLALVRSLFRLGRAGEAIDEVLGTGLDIHPITAAFMLALVGVTSPVDEVQGIVRGAADLWIGVAEQVDGYPDLARKKLFPLTRLDDAYLTERALLYLREPWIPRSEWDVSDESVDSYVERLEKIASHGQHS
ncbi:MAG: hypothetical protein GY708_03255 [Actinomycetia bacterium]|nr:hypothetical protein [Actinomycetes bacterium]MCP4959104.1 hypothetical protein [Actinomycetes bacterium]